MAQVKITSERSTDYGVIYYFLHRIPDDLWRTIGVSMTLTMYAGLDEPCVLRHY